MQSEPTESPGESVALKKKVHELQEALQEKETQLANLENQLKEYEAKVLEMEQVRDHSRSQSKAMLVVKQELDATKVNGMVRAVWYWLHDFVRTCTRMSYSFAINMSTLYFNSSDVT